MRLKLSLTWQVVIVVALALANTAVYRAVVAAPTLSVIIATAGKGTVAIIRTPNGHTLLIDTGSDASALRALGTTLPPWQRTVDAVILTSDKAAQTGGLSSIQGRYSVGSVLRIGTNDSPYGTQFTFGESSLTTLAPGQSTITYGTTTFRVSSSTPPDTYILSQS